MCSSCLTSCQATLDLGMTRKLRNIEGNSKLGEPRNLVPRPTRKKHLVDSAQKRGESRYPALPNFTLYVTLIQIPCPVLHAENIFHLQLVPTLFKFKYFDLFGRVPRVSTGLICYKINGSLKKLSTITDSVCELHHESQNNLKVVSEGCVHYLLFKENL